MRTTISLEDELVNEAKELSGITESGVLFREALRALIQSIGSINAIFTACQQ